MPKYRQIVRSVVNAIKQGDLKVGVKLPSINEVSVEFLLARETVVKAYNKLREMGIVVSRPGKGMYVCSEDIDKEYHIFLLFNKLSPHKKVVYDAFINEMGKEAKVRLFIYNNDFDTFKRLVEENTGNFTHYVIITHFFGVNPPVSKVLEKIPHQQLIMLDKQLVGTADECTSVYQDFGNDIKNALESAQKDLQKYERITLVFPASTYHSDEIKTGFKLFCEQVGFAYRIINSFDYDTRLREAFIILEESDLIALLNVAKDKNLTLGKDIGVISYNETPLKAFIAGGLSVMSTDFAAMGHKAAELVKSGKIVQTANPFKYIKRGSL